VSTRVASDRAEEKHTRNASLKEAIAHAAGPRASAAPPQRAARAPFEVPEQELREVLKGD
jgi:hypothetical protein